MPYATINGLPNSPTITGSYTDIELRCYPISLPTIRTAHNGAKPYAITSVSMWLRGRYFDVTCQLFVQSLVNGARASSAEFVVPYGYRANTETGFQNLMFTANANVDPTVMMGFHQTGPYTYNSVWLGNVVYSGSEIYDDYAYPQTWDTRSLVGQYTWGQVPTAPTFSTTAFTGITRYAFNVKWGAPSDNGGFSITGYKLQVSTTSNFTAPTTKTFDTTTASKLVDGLKSGTLYYVRVAAKNALSGIGLSPWSTVKQITTVFDPPVWQDDQLIGTMEENVAYGPDYLYAPSEDNSQQYRIATDSPQQLPSGITLTTYTATSGDAGLVAGKKYAKISGTPAVGTNGTRNVKFEAYNEGGVISKTITIRILPEASDWSDVTINDLMRKRFAYKAIDGTSTESVSATGTGVEYTVQSGSLPGGISIDQNTGQISGTPTSQGTFTFGIRAQNDSGTNAAPDPLTFTRIVRPSGTRFTGTGSEDKQDVSIFKKWSGTEWVDVALCKRWNGTDWVFTE